MILRLAIASLVARSLTVCMTILAIALSVALFLGVEKVRTGARASFADTISGTDPDCRGAVGIGTALAVFGVPDRECDQQCQLGELSGYRSAPRGGLDRADFTGGQSPAIPGDGNHDRIF